MGATICADGTASHWRSGVFEVTSGDGTAKTRGGLHTAVPEETWLRWAPRSDQNDFA